MKKFKKICLSTELKELYGLDNYQSHIEVNREYWYYFSKDSEVPIGYHKIKITYIRSGCAFYIFSDLPEVSERFFPIDCFMAATLIFAEIDPTKDLNDFGDELAKLIYRFDDEHTIVHNWPNEKTFEAEEGTSLYFVVKIFCKEVEKS